MIDFTEKVVSKSFDLATNAQDGNTEIAKQALEIVSDVKTGNQQETFRIIAAMVVTFGLGAILISTRTKV